jgi:hypothetical protein
MNPEKDPPAVPAVDCVCSRKDPEAGCQACGTSLSAYWCDVCQQKGSEKRCPLCGLKARKIRPERDGATSSNHFPIV